MKLTHVLATVLTLTALTAHAQMDEARPTMRTNVSKVRSGLGIKLIPTLGLSSGFMDTQGEKPSGDVTSEGGMTGGMLMEFGASRLTFQSGLLFVREGVGWNFRQNYSQDNSYYTFTSELKGHLDYLGIPLLAKINFPPNPGSSKFTVRTGLIPVVLTGLKVRMETADTGTNKKESSETTSADGVRAVNVMAMLALGGEFPLTKQTDLRIETQYTRGLLPISRQDDGPTRMYTQSLQLNVGLGFDI